MVKCTRGSGQRMFVAVRYRIACGIRNCCMPYSAGGEVAASARHLSRQYPLYICFPDLLCRYAVCLLINGLKFSASEEMHISKQDIGWISKGLM